MRSWELLIGKFLAALIPSLLLSWVAAAVYTVGMIRLVVSPKALGFIINETWLLIVLLCGPLLALLAIALMVAVSARVNDPRTAQQLSGFLIMPLVGLIVGQLSGKVVLGNSVVLTIAAGLAIMAAVCTWIALRLFDREVMLTRWR